LNLGKFSFLEKLDVPVPQTGQSDFQPMPSAIVCSVGLDPAKPDNPDSETGGSRISRITNETNEMMTANPDG
jgi:hypothetical protein